MFACFTNIAKCKAHVKMCNGKHMAFCVSVGTHKSLINPSIPAVSLYTTEVITVHIAFCTKNFSVFIPF